MRKNVMRIVFSILLMVGLLLGNEAKVMDAYAAGLDDGFPSDYKEMLQKMSASHPKWTFKLVNTNINWDDAVNGESKSNISLLSKSSTSDILLSKASGNYNAGTGSYIIKDGSSWVSASKFAVAYYMDPRNFLTDKYTFMFEALDYNSKHHSVTGVENILNGTDLYKKTISYTNTSGKVVTMNTTYGQAIFDAGKANGVSPLFLASKIKQETGASLNNNSISGVYSYNGVSYMGYYNFYNIGATSSGPGTAVTRGLDYAKEAGWTDPVKAINGGAKFVAGKYISVGQNTGYFQKFNVVKTPYYTHQYMQNLTAAATEGVTTYDAYNNMKIVNNDYVFYIPLYKNMPSLTSDVTISKSNSTGKANTDVNMRKGPSTSYDKITVIPKNAMVTISGAVFTDVDAIYTQLKNPYWYKVTYAGKTGYVAKPYIDASVDSTIRVGSTKQLSVKKASGEKVYYETSNPAIATVSESGLVKGVKEGNCEIYAVTSSGRKLDTIGIQVTKSLESTTLVSATNGADGVTIKWNKVTGAEGYRVYRKNTEGSWERIATPTSGSTVTYTDKNVQSGTKYTYTVRAYSGSDLGGYDSTGISSIYLSRPDLKNISVTSSSATVTWSEVNGADGYYVYRKLSGGDWSKIGTITSASTLIYTDKSVQPATTYYYTVRAYKSSYLSTYVSNGIGKMTSLEKVDMVSVGNDREGVTVKWTKTSNVDGYAVYRKSAGGDYGRIAIINNADTIQYTDEKASSGNNYTYTVRAIKGSELSDYDKDGKAILYLSMPELKSVSTTTNSVSIKWSEIRGAKGYNVYRKLPGGSWKKYVVVEGKDNIDYTDKGVQSASTYIYTVRAYNDDTLSSFVSAGISGTTVPDKEAMTSVTNVSGGVSVKWKSVPRVDGYAVYRKLPGGSWGRIATINNGTTVTYKDTTAKSGTKYIYTVRAFKENKYSDYEKAGHTIVYLSVPTLKSTTSTKNTIKVTWGKVTGATGYNVYRKVVGGSWSRIATVKSGNTVTYTNKSLSSKKTYYYTVRAYNGSYISSYVSSGIKGRTK